MIPYICSQNAEWAPFGTEAGKAYVPDAEPPPPKNHGWRRVPVHHLPVVFKLMTPVDLEGTSRGASH